jgi:hypothetical protein
MCIQQFALKKRLVCFPNVKVLKPVKLCSWIRATTIWYLSMKDQHLSYHTPQLNMILSQFTPTPVLLLLSRIHFDVVLPSSWSSEQAFLKGVWRRTCILFIHQHLLLKLHVEPQCRFPNLSIAVLLGDLHNFQTSLPHNPSISYSLHPGHFFFKLLKFHTSLSLTEVTYTLTKQTEQISDNSKFNSFIQTWINIISFLVFT